MSSGAISVAGQRVGGKRWPVAEVAETSRCTLKAYSAPFSLVFARGGRYKLVLTCSNLKSKKIAAGGGRPGQFLSLASARAVSAGWWLRWLRVRSARSRRTGHLWTSFLREEEDMSMYLPRKI